MDQSDNPKNRPLRVWLIKAGEPLPIDDTPRLMRTGQLASLLRKQGVEVTWWSSTFNHSAKTQYAKKSEARLMPDGTKLWLLHGMPYKRNISLARIFNHWQMAREFDRIAPSEPPPDVVVASWPTLDFAKSAVRFCKKYHATSIIDIRDLWPEVFIDLFPRPLAPIARILLEPQFRNARRILNRADAVVAITNPFLEWGMQFAGRISNPTMNRAFPLAYEPRKLSEEEELEASVFWRRFDESLFKDRSIVCFFGNLSHRIELKTVVDAASHLSSIDHNEIIFIIGGEGECLASLKKRASGLNNIIFPGWLNFSAIRYLMQRSTFGVLPYPSSKDFVRSYPNKIGEYLSTGLAVLSSTDGAVASLIENETCGYRYCPESGKSLAETIMNALGDPVELARRRVCSINVFNRMFNADIVYGEYTNYIQELGDQSRKRRPL